MPDRQDLWRQAFDSLSRDFPDLREVPILKGATIIGMSRQEDNASLIFLSPEYGEVIIEISPKDGGPLIFRYTVWDDRLGTSWVKRGEHGDPRYDEMEG